MEQERHTFSETIVSSSENMSTSHMTSTMGENMSFHEDKSSTHQQSSSHYDEQNSIGQEKTIEAAGEDTVDNSHSTALEQTLKGEEAGNASSSLSDAAPDDYKHTYPTGPKLWSILLAVTLTYYLLFLDLAVISTATPTITTEFDSLTDIAQSSNMFIVGRAVAGLGSSGLFNGSMTTIANVLPMARRPLIMGINMGIGELGLACGPLIGGAFTSNVSWRWCFYINLPLGALVGICLLLNNVPEAETKPPVMSVFGTAIKSLDLFGFVLIAPAAIMFMLALEWGGSKYAWDDSVVIGLFVGAAVTFAIFLAWEYRQGDEAMIPFAMLRSPVVRAAAMTQFFSLGSTLVADYYLAIFFQAIQNDSALMSGVHMLPTTLGMVVFTIVTGGLTQATGYFTPWVLLGASISTIGYGLLSTLSRTTSTGRWIGYQLFYGAGSGIASSGPYIAIQNLVPLEQTPTVMAIVIFTQNLGAAVWVVVANTIFNNALKKQLNQRAAQYNLNTQALIANGATGLHKIGLTANQLVGVMDAYGKSVDQVMYLGIGIAGSILLVAWGLGFDNIKTIKKKEALTNENTLKEKEAGKEEDIEKQNI
nr:Efflux pump [Penicillium sclerotiorum]